MARRKITNEEEALAAVKEDGEALQYVPAKLRDYVRRRMESGE